MQIIIDHNHKNRNRVDHNYKVVDKFILTKHTVYKYDADDGMIASSDPRWLQWAFTVLVV